MSEDCLTLNIARPAWGIDESLPVLVFIHGGAYLLGSSAAGPYRGAALARRGCVYVSINYRLGALGSLDLSSLATDRVNIDTNLSLRDIVMALQWVQDNIAAFGGDPGNVTVFGESAGAHAAATLLAVPAAQGLFHRAIAQSPAMNLTRTADQAAAFASRFAALLGAGARDAAAAVIDAEPAQLVSAMETLMQIGARDTPGIPALGPSIDGDVLPLDPIDAMRQGQAAQLPLVVGSNKDEGRLFTRMLRYLPLDPPSIEKMLAPVDSATREQILAAYPGYPDRDSCINIGGDRYFTSAAWELAEAHGSHAPTYLYRYDYAPRPLRWSGMGATHSTELLAVFGLYRSPVGQMLTVFGDRASATRVGDEMLSRWLAFARTDVPGHNWPRYRQPGRPAMVFDRASRVEYDANAARRIAWQEFINATRGQVGHPVAGATGAEVL